MGVLRLGALVLVFSISPLAIASFPVVASPLLPKGLQIRLGVLKSSLLQLQRTWEYINRHLNFNEHTTKTASDCMFKLTRVNRIKDNGIKHLLDKKKKNMLSSSANYFIVRRYGVARARRTCYTLPN